MLLQNALKLTYSRVKTKLFAGANTKDTRFRGGEEKREEGRVIGSNVYGPPPPFLSKFTPARGPETETSIVLQFIVIIL